MPLLPPYLIALLCTTVSYTLKICLQNPRLVYIVQDYMHALELATQ